MRISKAPTRTIKGNPISVWNPKLVLALPCLSLFTLAIASLMTMPALDPTGFNNYHTGTVFSVLWCVGLLAWALRAVRSNQSRFSIATVAGMTTFVAIGFVNVFVAMAIVFLAIVFDFGVVGKTESWTGITWRAVQMVAGMTETNDAADCVQQYTALKCDGRRRGRQAFCRRQLNIRCT